MCSQMWSKDNRPSNESLFFKPGVKHTTCLFCCYGSLLSKSNKPFAEVTSTVRSLCSINRTIAEVGGEIHFIHVMLQRGEGEKDKRESETLLCVELWQGSAIHSVNRAIWGRFPPDKIHLDPHNLFDP